MRATYYKITDDRLIKPLEADGVAAEWAQARTPRWVDVEQAGEQELAVLLRPLQLPPLLIGGVQSEGRSARVMPLESAVFFELPTPPEGEAMHGRHVSIVCLPSLLVTVHKGPLASLDERVRALGRDMRLATPTVRALVYQILEGQIDDTLQRGMALRDEVEALSRTEDRAPEAVDLGSIVRAKERLAVMSAVCEDQLYCVEALLSAQSAAFCVGPQREDFDDLAGHLEHALRTLNRLEAHANELRLYYVLGVQERTERRLGALTIISAVFLPLTLLVGIYGMNFPNIPGMAHPLGFWTMMGAMGAIGAGLLLYFRAKGWFR